MGFMNTGSPYPNVTAELMAKADAEIAKQNPPPAPMEDPTPAQDAAAVVQRRSRSRASTILTGANQAQGIGPGVGTISRRMLLGS